MLVECIAMSAFSSNFNLSKKFRTLIFAYEFYHYKYTTLLACHSPKLENLIMLKVVFWQVITVSFQFNIISEGWNFPKDSDKISSTWQNKFNIIYYKQNVVTNNEFCYFY